MGSPGRARCLFEGIIMGLEVEDIIGSPCGLCLGLDWFVMRWFNLGGGSLASGVFYC